MARIRTIKPEFPQSESMGRVSRDARLTFLMLFTLADDSGRLRGNSRMLASLLFPYDEDGPHLIDGWLSELEGEGCVTRYRVDGSNYLEISNWLIHQKIDKPSQSKLPALDGHSRRSASSREGSSEDQGSKDQGRDLDHLAGTGSIRGPNDNESIGISTAHASRLQSDWTLPKDWGDWTLTDSNVNAAGKWTDDHLRFQADRFRDYWHAKAGKDACKVDWFAVWRNWCRSGLSAMPAGRQGHGGSWRASEDAALAKARDVGVGPANPGESKEAWFGRIDAAIGNGGKPPTLPSQTRALTEPAVNAPEPRAASSDASRAALSGARAVLRKNVLGAIAV